MPWILFVGLQPETVDFSDPSLPPGEYLLRWSTLTPAEKWQTRTEVSVNGTTCFRWRKKASSDNPVKGGTLLLVVA